MEQHNTSKENIDPKINNDKLKNEKRSRVALWITVAVLVFCVILGIIGVYGRIVYGGGFSDTVLGILQFEVDADETDQMIPSSNGYFTVTGGIEGVDYIFADQSLLVQSTTPLHISTNGEPTGTEQIKIQVIDGIADLTIHSIKINTASIDNFYGVLIADGGLHLYYDGDNEITSGAYKAGIQSDGFPLTLTALNEDASLTVTGGYLAAGIGGGSEMEVSSIEINGGNIRAVGGNNGAGIGAGSGGSVTSIIIRDADVKVSGGYGAAGIGGGNAGEKGTSDVANIELYGSTITAFGGSSAAGIGGGFQGSVEKLLIDQCTIQVVSEAYGAGIGGGNYGSLENATIQYSYIFSMAGDYGAGIGGGYLGSGSNITIIQSEISSTGGRYGAGIGGGFQGSAKSIFIKDQSKIYAWAGDQAAGIGSGNNMSEMEEQLVPYTAMAYDIFCYDSFLYAVGGTGGAGIGGGNLSRAENLNFKNCEIIALGGNYASGIGGGNYGAAIHISVDSSDIRSTGGTWGAGIGGGYSGKLEDLSVSSSIIYAVGGSDDGYPAAGGAGIGGGDSAGADQIQILGSTVNAISLGYGSGIGAGGRSGELGQLVIDGGNVSASGANAIGNGLYQKVAPKNKDSEEVYPIMLELANPLGEKKVKNIVVCYESGVERNYDISGTFVGENGMLTLYVPEGMRVKSITTEDGTYYAKDSEGILVTREDKQIHTFSQDISIRSLSYSVNGGEKIPFDDMQLQVLQETGYLSVLLDDSYQNGARITLQGSANDTQTIMMAGKEQILKNGMATLYVTLKANDKVTMQDFVVYFYKDDASVDFQKEYEKREEEEILIEYLVDGKKYYLSELQVKEASKYKGVLIPMSGFTKSNEVIVISAFDRGGTCLCSKTVSLRNGKGDISFLAAGKQYQIGFYSMSSNTSIESMSYEVDGVIYDLSVAEIAQAAGNRGLMIEMPEADSKSVTLYAKPTDEKAYCNSSTEVSFHEGTATVLVTVYAEDRTFTKNYLVFFTK